MGNLSRERARWDVVGRGIVVKTGLPSAVMLRTESGVAGEGQVLYTTFYFLCHPRKCKVEILLSFDQGSANSSLWPKPAHHMFL